MYKVNEIVEKVQLTDVTYEMTIYAPRTAKSCQPGQFLIVVTDVTSERIPLTIADFDREEGTITIAVQAVGGSTKKLGMKKEGDVLFSLEGPLGHPAAFIYEDLNELKKKKYVFIGGGLGIAPVYPQVRWFKEHGMEADVIIGAKTGDMIFWEDKMREVGNVYVTTDDGSYGRSGMVTNCLEDLVVEEGKEYDHCVVIGPMVMMKFATILTKNLEIPTTVSMNPIMVDGTGMCGACRVEVDGETKFACVDGPEFDGHKVDFDQAMNRTRLFRTPEGREALRAQEGENMHTGEQGCQQTVEQYEYDPMVRVPIAEQDPLVRSNNFDEVCLGYTVEEAQMEAERCLDCKNPQCVEGCPVSINIPGFIQEIKHGNFEESFQILSEDSTLPAVCGRVCPQEEQCEGKCIRGIKGDPIAIGKLERFAADYARKNDIQVKAPEAEKTGKKVAIIGAGPAGLACASDLAKAGHDVKIFESLHLSGGVLQYGIPEFRLPKTEVVDYEVENVKKLGVEFENSVFVGRTVTIKELMENEGFDAVFLGSGAGLPIFMDIPGENANGVFSANEYLTRSNLMKAYDEDYDTNIHRGKSVVTVGGGNVAMDAARTALRLGAKSRIVYRRGEEELPARTEEVHHAKEEGVIFNLLQNVKEILVDDQGWVSGVKCIKMELGEPDASGRRRPIEIPGSEFVVACDTVIMALGTRANPVATTGSDEIEKNEKGGIIIDENCMTTMPGVFAGGDSVTGSATVILAMGAGREAAAGINQYLAEN